MTTTSSDALRIVIIEDDRTIGLSAQAYLQNEGYQVEWYREGTAGMTAIVDHSPDVIVLDMLLPGGLKGFTILQLLKERGLTDRTIVTTGLTDDRTEQYADQYGAVRFIRKPYRNRDLLDVIRELLAAESSVLSGEKLRQRKTKQPQE